MALAGRSRIGFAAWTRRMASSSARCSALRFGLVVGFMTSLRRFGYFVSGDWANDQRVGQIQNLKYDGDETACVGCSKGDRPARRFTHVEHRISGEQRGLNLSGRQPMFSDMGRVAPFVVRVVPINQGIADVHAVPSLSLELYCNTIKSKTQVPRPGFGIQVAAPISLVLSRSPRVRERPMRNHQDCIDACLHCAQECEHCANACLTEDDVNGRGDCIRMHRDCAAMCWLTAGALSPCAYECSRRV